MVDMISDRSVCFVVVEVISRAQERQGWSTVTASFVSTVLR